MHAVHARSLLPAAAGPLPRADKGRRGGVVLHKAKDLAFPPLDLAHSCVPIEARGGRVLAVLKEAALGEALYVVETEAEMSDL